MGTNYTYKGKSLSVYGKWTERKGGRRNAYLKSQGDYCNSGRSFNGGTVFVDAQMICNGPTFNIIIEMI